MNAWKKILAALAGVVLVLGAPATAFAAESLPVVAQGEEEEPPEQDSIAFNACRHFPNEYIWGSAAQVDGYYFVGYNGGGSFTYGHPIPQEGFPTFIMLFSPEHIIPCIDNLNFLDRPSWTLWNIDLAPQGTMCAVYSYRHSRFDDFWGGGSWVPDTYACGYICPPQSEFDLWAACFGRINGDIADGKIPRPWGGEEGEEWGDTPDPNDYADPGAGRVCVLDENGDRVCGQVSPEDYGNPSLGKPITVDPGNGQPPVTGIPDCTVTGGQLDTWVCEQPDDDEGYDWGACVPDIDVSWGNWVDIDFDAFECVSTIVTNVFVPSDGTMGDIGAATDELKEMFPVNVLTGLVETATRSSSDWDQIAAASGGTAWTFVIFGEEVILMEEGSDPANFAEQYRTPITWIIITASAAGFAMAWAGRAIFRLTDKS